LVRRLFALMSYVGLQDIPEKRCGMLAQLIDKL